MARTTIPAELVAVNAIQGTLIADNAITAVHIATNAVSGTLVADNSITSTHIAQNNVTATQIAQNTITVTQLADSAVETAKLNNDAVTQAKIADDAVGADQLAANSVVSASIVNGSIVEADMADNAVTLAKMASLARGSIIVGDSAGDPSALSIGSNTYVLTSDGTDISWAAASGGVDGISSSADATAMTIDSNENVGIGTTSPNHYANYKTLTIDSPGSGSGAVIDLEYRTTRSLSMFSESGGSTVREIRDATLSLGANNSNKMTIHTSGCVGIGSTVDRSIDTNVGTLVINGSAGGGLWLSDDDQSSTTSKIYSFTEGSVGKLRINQGSGVGGGGIDFTFNENYTAPNMRLTTVDTLFGKTSNDLDTAGAHIISAGTYAGSVYSGITSAVASSTYHVRDTTNNTWEFYVTNAGVINATSTSISSLSDERLKENIKDLETGLDEVMALKPRRFDWKDREEKNVAGFIAQEVEPVLPDLIGDFMHDDLDDAKTVKMSDMIPTLVKAIQEQQEIIEELKANSHPCKELHEFDAYPDLIKRIEELENK